MAEYVKVTGLFLSAWTTDDAVAVFKYMISFLYEELHMFKKAVIFFIMLYIG